MALEKQQKGIKIPGAGTANFNRPVTKYHPVWLINKN
jgi:hypothetical protein